MNTYKDQFEPWKPLFDVTVPDNLDPALRSTEGLTKEERKDRKTALMLNHKIQLLMRGGL